MQICDYNACTGCETCIQICPVNCIELYTSEEGFTYPKIEESKCTKCQKCIRTCPNNKKNVRNKSIFYMGWHKDVEVLRHSSSGGAFTAIADYVLGKQGVVFGAFFDEKTHDVKHVAIEKTCELDKIRLSKYYQGIINGSYNSVKCYLSQGRLVLFSGTSCQISGLYAFLDCDINTKPQNLITVDILCHGITSKRIVDAYIRSKEKKYNKKIRTFRFRLKPDDSDWFKGNGGMRIDFFDGTSKVQDKETDTFFVGFNNYLFLRRSCYQCGYVGIDRIADFTIADFWGVPYDKISEEQRKFGVSLVLTNSNVANEILPKLSNEFYYENIDAQEAIPYNQAFEKASTENYMRSEFFSKILYSDFDKLVYRMYRRFYIKVYIRRALYKILGEKNTILIMKAIKK